MLSALGLGLAGALLSAALIPGVASAAPGDASARGVVIDLAGRLGGTVLVGANAVVGAADAPAGGGTDSAAAADVGAAVTGAVAVTATGSVDQVTATREATGSSATASVTGLSLGVLGVPALAAATAEATVDCPLTGALTADTTLTGLTLFGTAVTLDANAPAVTATAAVTVPGVSLARLRVTLTRVETVTGTDATAVAIRAAFVLDAGSGGLAVQVPLGTVTIASATCTRPAAAPAAPTATGLTPDSGPTAGGTTVTITGTNLAGTSAVTFDGVPATILSRTATTVVVRTPAHPAGPVDVVLTTPGGTATLPDAFTYLTPGDAPTVDALTPDQGPTTGGQTVVITGSGFTPGTTVTFDGVPATSVEVVDGGTLIVRTPPGAAGPADVVVTVDGVASDPFRYTYLAGAPVPAAPSADALDPETGPTTGGTSVTVVGSGFVPGQTSVIVCGTTLLGADVDVAADGRSLTFTTPECAAGPAEVVVVTPGGVAPALGFTYTDGTGDDAGNGDVGDVGDAGNGDVGDAGGDSLPDTGADVVGISLLGLALLVVGAVLTRQARRRPVATG